MKLNLSVIQKNELRKKLVAIHFAEFDEEISDFKSERLLDVFLEKPAPAIYTTAVQDMKKFMFTQLEDMEAIYEKE